MRFLILSFAFSVVLHAEEPWSISAKSPVTVEVFQRGEHAHKQTSFVFSSAFSFYQKYISPVDGQSCHYYPSCSVYSQQAVQRYGPIRGGLMSTDRLLRCHPGQKEHFYDPVP